VRRNKKTTHERLFLPNFDTDLQQGQRYLKTFGRIFMKEINILEARWPLPNNHAGSGTSIGAAYDYFCF
jgi:hypothetical protein